MNLPKEHSKPSDWPARSYVVHRVYGGQYIVKTSHWRVGYTPMYCATPLEAIRAAMAVNDKAMMDLQMRANQLHDLHREEYYKAHPEEDMLGVESIPTALAEATRALTVKQWAEIASQAEADNEIDEGRKAEIGAEYFVDPEGRDDGKMTPEQARALGLLSPEDQQ